MVRLGVDVIVSGNHLSTIAAMKATTTIPIVMTSSADPVSTGLVASLARPGGNVTGFSLDGGNEGEMQGKRLGILKETLPSLMRVGMLWNPDGALDPARLDSMQGLTQPLGLKLVAVEARGLNTLDQAFATMVREQMQAFILVSDTVLFNYRQHIAALALKNRLPSTSSLKEFAEAGLLLSYGPDFQSLYGGAAVFIDKIFKGAKPADLPVERPTRFELVVNLKTAKALGLTVPPSVLARVDEVIE
jgi:putative ABC transport system substrate-binding protein